MKESEEQPGKGKGFSEVVGYYLLAHPSNSHIAR